MLAIKANLSNLREYLCDNVTGIQVGKDLRTINAYPFIGDPKLGYAPHDVVGFDLDNDGRLDIYVAKTPSQLTRFINEAATDLRYARPQSWGAPLAISRERLLALTGHCREISPLVLRENISTVVTGAGFVTFIGGAMLSSAPLIAVGGVVILGGIISAIYYNGAQANAFADIHQTVLKFLPKTTAQN